jgi:hypothetical protein
MESMNEEQEHEQEIRETKGSLLDLLLIGEGPLLAVVGAVLAALGFGLKKRRRRRRT